MKLKYLSFMASAFLATAFLASCSSDDIVQNGQDNNNGNNGNVTGVIFEGATQTPTSRASGMPGVKTRTTATHTIGGGAKVFWEATDNIWVEDDGGTFQQNTSMAFPNPADQSEAKFGLTTGSFTGTTHKVVYTGKGSTSATEVEIKANQTQTVTNSFAHLGESGDCGIATATKLSSGRYKFTLEHKAAYLCIYPRIQNDPLHKNVKVNKIVLTSTSGPIAGKYAFSATNGLGSSPTPTSNASNTITLTTTSGEISSATRVDTCYYVVIAPGTHTLKAEYYIEDPTTLVSAVVSKELGAIPCNEGKITDVSAWIDKGLKNYSYYMWDAAKPYWDGYEWNNTNPANRFQPITNGSSDGTHAPQNNTDPRWYNETFNGSFSIPVGGDAATPLFKTLPDASTAVWYAMKGDPHWDANKLFTTFGHLYKGGMWFKKLNKIAADEGVTTAFMKIKVIDPVSGNYEDIGARTYWAPSVSSTALTATEQADYFFLPALGYYDGNSYAGVAGTLQGLGTAGMYWTSSSTTTMPGYAYHLEFSSSSAKATYYTFRTLGLVAEPFQ